MNRQLLQRIKDDILKYPLEDKDFSEDFAGVYLHSNSPFKAEDHQGPIHSFRTFSRKHYPLYIFISEDSVTDDFSQVYKDYGDIRVRIIPTLKDIYEFNNFSINNLLYLIDSKHQNLIYFQEDGFLLRSGWEEQTSNYSWLGSAWKEPIKVIEDKFNFPPVQIGNGGCCFRKRDKCLKVLDLVNQNGGQQQIVKGVSIDGIIKHNNSFLAEDLFFCYFGFGAGIFRPVSLEFIDNFALEPITYRQAVENPPFLFHRCDFYE